MDALVGSQYMGSVGAVLQDHIEYFKNTIIIVLPFKLHQPNLIWCSNINLQQIISSTYVNDVIWILKFNVNIFF